MYNILYNMYNNINILLYNIIDISVNDQIMHSLILGELNKVFAKKKIHKLQFKAISIVVNYINQIKKLIFLKSWTFYGLNRWCF